MTDYPISQSEIELAGLLRVFKDEGVRSFLEIGSRFGGSLWEIGRTLPKGSKIVSVDSGKGMGGRQKGSQDSLVRCVYDLRRAGYDSHLVIGHSQKQSVMDRALAHGPFDAVFLDGDHTYFGVHQDWLNYGMDAKICAFHDIAWQRPEGYEGKNVDVPEVWNRVKAGRRFREFIDPQFNYGIGVVWN